MGHNELEWKVIGRDLVRCHQMGVGRDGAWLDGMGN